MTERVGKPVRKCYGCGLNLRKHCGVFENPAEMWTKGTCPGYQNEELLAQYMEATEHHVKTPKELRQERAKLQKTEPHWQGLPSKGTHH